MAKLIALFCFFLFAGCASQLTPEQQEWKRSVERENWVNCMDAYAASPTGFTIHTHVVMRRREHRPMEMRDDLFTNSCKHVLGDAWVEYGEFIKPDKEDGQSNKDSGLGTG